MDQVAVDALRHTYESKKKTAEYVFKNAKNDLLAMDKAVKDWSAAHYSLCALDWLEDEYDTLPSLFD